MGYAIDYLIHTSAVGLASYNSNWADPNAHFSTVAGSGLQATVQSVGLAYYNADTFANDQWAEIELVNPSGGSDYIGPAVRCSNGNGYLWYVSLGAGLWYWGHLVNSAYTVVDSGNTTGWAGGNKLRIEVQGTTVRLKRNGAQVGSDYTGRTEHSSGRPGICGYHNSADTGTSGRNWIGSDFGAAPKVHVYNARKGVAGAAAVSVNTAGAMTRTGSLFVACAFMDTDVGTITPSDTINGAASGNTWSLVSEMNTDVGAKTAIWKCENGNGGANHVFTLSTNGDPAYQTVALLEIEQAPPFAAIDQDDVWQSSTSTVEAGPITTTNAVDLLIGIIVGNTSTNPTAFPVSANSVPTSGWKLLLNELNGADYWTFAIYAQRVTATGTYDFEASESTAPSLVGHILAIKEAAVVSFRAWDYRPDVQQIFHNSR